MAKSKLAKYRSKRRKNVSDEVAGEAKAVATSIAAGFAGYAATRLISRVAYSQAVKKWPKASKHIHFASSAITGLGIFFGSKYSKKTKDYQEELIIGSGIAILQSALQTYMPKFGWVVSDVDPSQYGVKNKKQLPAANIMSILPADAEPQAELPAAGFDLDAFLAENNEVEAVPIGQAPPIEAPAAHKHAEAADDDSDGIFDEGIFGAMGDDSDLENFNGFIN